MEEPILTEGRQRNQPVLATWLLWQVLTGISFVIASGVLGPIAAGLDSPAARFGVAAALSALGGAVIGVVQLLFLRLPVKGARMWTLVASIGWLAALGVVLLVVRLLSWPAGGLLGAALAGTGLGLVQSRLLYAEGTLRTRWPAMTALGWVTAAAAMALLYRDAGAKMTAAGLGEVASQLAVAWAVLSAVALMAFILLFPEYWRKTGEEGPNWWS